MAQTSCDSQLGVYHQESYWQSAAMLETEGELHVFRRGESFVPLILKPIPSACGPGYDAMSPYDFSGPMLRGEPSSIVWQALRSWALDRGMISAFFRFHPFSEDALSWNGLDGLEIIPSAQNVVVDLNNRETMLSSFKRSVFRDVKVARRYGVTMALRPLDSAGLDEFVPLYNVTMDRRHAYSFYYFPRSFFDTLADHLPDRWMLAAARIADETVASALILLDGPTAYYYLACSNDIGRKSCAMNYLVYETSLQLQSMGLEKFHLGGGADSLRRFKERFGPGRVPYYVGRAVFDRPRYEQLCTGLHTDFFPAYRVSNRD